MFYRWEQRQAMRRGVLFALVDEFYERHVKLIISAEVELEKLYTNGQLEDLV